MSAPGPTPAPPPDSTNILMVVVVLVVAVVFIIFVAVLVWLKCLESGKRLNEIIKEKDQDMARRIETSDGDRPSSKMRAALERDVQNQIEGLKDIQKVQGEQQELFRRRYEERFHHHVYVLGEDPDTMGLPPKLRTLRKDIKDLQKKVDDKEVEAAEMRKQRAEEDEEEQMNLLTEQVTPTNLLGFGEKDEKTFLDRLLGTGLGREKKNSQARRLVEYKDRIEHFKEELLGMEQREEFKRMDIDNSGYLDRAEVKRRMRATLGDKVTDADVEKVFAEVDVDQNGKIDLAEFLRYCVKQEYHRVKDAKGEPKARPRGSSIATTCQDDGLSPEKRSPEEEHNDWWRGQGAAALSTTTPPSKSLEHEPPPSIHATFPGTQSRAVHFSTHSRPTGRVAPSHRTTPVGLQPLPNLTADSITHPTVAEYIRTGTTNHITPPRRKGSGGSEVVEI